MSRQSKVLLRKDEADERLERRWVEQTLLFPRMRRDIPLALYLSVNRSYVMRHGLLAAYQRPA